MPASADPGGARAALCETGLPGGVTWSETKKHTRAETAVGNVHGHERGLDSTAKRLLLPKN
jgi:hypothetical protein